MMYIGKCEKCDEDAVRVVKMDFIVCVKHMKKLQDFERMWLGEKGGK
jgi:hypothetical protein